MTGSDRWGAYGFHLSPTPGTRWLQPAPARWPTMHLSHVSGASERVPTSEGVAVTVTDRQVRVDVGTGWRLQVGLDASRAAYRDIGFGDPEFAHPALAAAASMLSRARGRDAFHAGGAVIGDRAWGVLGPREAGKTTLLAALAARGAGIVADDLLVIDDGTAYAGPRCLDLRHDPGHDLPTTRVRDGLRHRMTLPPVPAEIPFGGFLFLRWADTLALEPVDVRDRLDLLAGSATWVVEPQDPVRLLDAATFPAWWLNRPRDLGALDDCVDLLLSRLGRG